MSELWEILGGDVSFWQGVWDWKKAKNAGWRFAFIRAGSITSTGGVLYTDDQFENNAEFAPPHLPVGFYWYFRPNYDPIKQADYFCNLIRDKDWKLPPVLDIEVTGNLSPSQVTAKCAQFVARVYEQLGVWCLIYSRSYFMRDQMVYHVLFNECDVWIARYVNKPLPYNNPGENPRLVPPWGKHCVVWQKSAENNASIQYGGLGPPNGDDDVDLNYFHGTEEEFQLWIGNYPKGMEIVVTDQNGAVICRGDIPENSELEFGIKIQEK